MLSVLDVTSQSREQVRDIVGFAAVGVNISLYASPFETIRQVLNTKSAATLPIAMCSVAAVNCSLWLICSIVDNDMFILTPNVIGVTLSAIQVTLYVMHTPTVRVRFKSDTWAVVMATGVLRTTRTSRSSPRPRMSSRRRSRS